MPLCSFIQEYVYSGCNEEAMSIYKSFPLNKSFKPSLASASHMIVQFSTDEKSLSNKIYPLGAHIAGLTNAEAVYGTLLYNIDKSSNDRCMKAFMASSGSDTDARGIF